MFTTRTPLQHPADRRRQCDEVAPLLPFQPQNERPPQLGTGGAYLPLTRRCQPVTHDALLIDRSGLLHLKTSYCGSACTGAPRSTSATSPARDEQKSPRSATKPTKPRASRQAQAADERSPRKLSSNASTRMISPRSESSHPHGLHPARRLGDRDREGSARRPGDRSLRSR